MATCTNKDFTLADCNGSPSGIDKFVMEYNLTDWLVMERGGLITRAANGTIENIVNSVGVKAYKREVPSNGIILPVATPAQVEGGFPNFRLTFNYTFIATDQDAKNAAKSSLYKDKVLIIYKNTGEGEVWGDEQGMILSGGAYDPSNISTGNQIPLEMATDERKSGESNYPISIADPLGAQATLDMILALDQVGV